jgi:16S rRNA (cytosine1402-N4)-methyltransferase
MGIESSLQHVPVMRDVAVDLLKCGAGGRYVDGTVGGGGYAEAILAKSAPDGVLVALDLDVDAIDRVRERFQGDRGRLRLERANYADLSEVLEKLDLGPVDGIVLDLGVSSFQLEDSSRGFSFMNDGPLDMRMDRGLTETAADLVNSLGEKELASLIYELGEERYSRRIARTIVSRRKTAPFRGTVDLARAIGSAVPKTKDRLRIHPATRTFQALRIAVNRELEALQRFLASVLGILSPGGRVVVVSFHSLEDRMVKQAFREWAKRCRCPLDELRCRCEGRPLVRLLTKKALRPSAEEIEANPRSRSAKLRAVEKI